MKLTEIVSLIRYMENNNSFKEFDEFATFKIVKEGDEYKLTAFSIDNKKAISYEINDVVLSQIRDEKINESGDEKNGE